MPLQSKSQQRFMFARMPKTAKRWAHETPDMKSLPEKKHQNAAKRALKKGKSNG